MKNLPLVMASVLVVSGLGACAESRTEVAYLPASNDRNPVRTVEAQLELATTLAGFDGYRRVNEPYVVLLDEDEEDSVQIDLVGGVEHAILVVCDDDCDDVDVALFDRRGNLIDSDTTSDDTATIEGVTPYTGTYTVRIDLSDCDADPCAVAAAAFYR